MAEIVAESRYGATFRNNQVDFELGHYTEVSFASNFLTLDNGKGSDQVNGWETVDIIQCTPKSGGYEYFRSESDKIRFEDGAQVTLKLEKKGGKNIIRATQGRNEVVFEEQKREW